MTEQWSRSDTFWMGFLLATLVTALVLIGIFMLAGTFKTNCDQHIIDAATETIDERLNAELVLCDYEGALLP